MKCRYSNMSVKRMAQLAITSAYWNCYTDFSAMSDRDVADMPNWFLHAESQKAFQREYDKRFLLRPAAGPGESFNLVRAAE